MSHLCTTFTGCLAIALVLFLPILAAAQTGTAAPAPQMELSLSFAPDLNLLRGTARVTLPAHRSISLSLAGITVTGAVISSPGRENQVVTLAGSATLTLAATDVDRTLLLSYEKYSRDDPQNLISREAIVLTSGWHPVPEHRITFSLTAQLPPGFTAVSESDVFAETSPEGAVRFSFSQPVYHLSFAAAPYVKTSRTVREGLTVYTLFFPEDQALAADYLESAAAYLNRYEERIGPFPYNHYVIAENIRPTGFGLPTFTLLVRQVLRLPFIRQTSLGHEILHSWFGNSVDVDVSGGNWCEGLTTYLADLAYRSEAGEGAAARKETILTYLSYVSETTPPLQDFVSAGHDLPGGRAARAVGYGRAALLFHELRTRFGAEPFDNVIRRLYRQFRGSSASWQDLQNLFEQETGTSLATFFHQRLSRTDLPDLQVDGISVRQGVEVSTLTFTIHQRSEEPYELFLPVTVETLSGPQRFTHLLTAGQSEITLSLDSQPLKLVIDPDYDVMRRLDRQEDIPVLSRFLGAANRLVVLAAEDDRTTFAPLLALAARSAWRVETAAALSQQDIAGASLLVLGSRGELSRSLFALPDHPEDGFTLDVRFNPLNRAEVIALVSARNPAEVEAVAHRLEHYGSASYLHFNNGRLEEKKIGAAARGLQIVLEERPFGMALTALTDFDRLVERLRAYRVVYIGETHTSRADHLLQLQLIAALHRQTPGLVIGMEMFPRSSQAALDAYISGATSDEAEFLRDSRYFSVWRYDYRLFRPIFAYARRFQLPVIGLNLDRDIVSSVFKTGTPESLTPEQRRSVPVDRRLDMPGYIERLEATHAMHGGQQHGGGSFEGFLQAQALWDETMAASIAAYLADHPGASMVVLAGSQHTRKDSGIPPRLARQLAVSQATVSNLATSTLSGASLLDTTDYLFFLDTDDLPPAGRIGIVLEELKGGAPGLTVIDIEARSGAGAAGIRKADRLVRVAGRPVADMDDVRAVLFDRVAGETITIVVSRAAEDGGVRDHTLEVTLFDPETVKPHP